MFKFLSSLKISRVFLLSILFLTFIIFIVVTIFSTFIYNNSRSQLVESLYIQAQSINKLLPNYDESINFDDFADNLAIKDTNFNELRVTIIDKDWYVIGDSLVDSQNLYLLEKHSPDTRIEIQDALNNIYGTTIRTSESTGLDLIYVAIQEILINLNKV